MWISILFGLFLIAFATVMLIQNAKAWQSTQTDELEEQERDFRYRQYRRRLQANWMIAIVGLAVIVGVWVTDSLVAAAYWLGVLLIVGWMALLAVADVVATRMYYGRIRQDQQAERAVLKAQLEQIKRRGSNGKPTK